MRIHPRIVLLSLAGLVLILPLVSFVPAVRALAVQQFERFGGGPISPPTPPITTPVPPSPTPTPPISPPVPPITPPGPNLSNNPPTVVTTALPNGKVGVDYWQNKAEIVAFDKDGRDKLTLVVENLPAGLRMGPCNIKNAGNGVDHRCWIIGTPTKAGLSSVKVTVTDQAGATASRNVPLSVVK